jgi:predicted nucleic acid-binding protein
VKVIDASVMLEVLHHSRAGEQLLAHFDDDLFAPDLLISEILNRLRHDIRSGQISEGRALAAVDTLVDADIEFLPVWPYTTRIWELRHNVTSYDAAYVAMAEDLGCPLLTRDLRVARAPGLKTSVITG